MVSIITAGTESSTLPPHPFILTCTKFQPLKTFVFALILLLFPGFSLPVPAQQLHDQPDPFSKAKELHRPMLLIFSGSDWCLPCQWLERKILTDSSFEEFAGENLVLLKADFPQKKKLPPETAERNERLAEEFNPEGVFPFLVLLSPERTILTLLEFENYSPEHFIDQIKEAIQKGDMLKEFAARTRLMGSAFEFIVTAAYPEAGSELLQNCITEVQRIEKLLTEFNEESETSLINHNAGNQTIVVSDETYSLIQRSIQISKLSQGAFDITAGALKKLYDFKRKEIEIPSDDKINVALKKTGFKKIQLMPGNKVYLKEAGMQIGFGAIGKGYAADRVKKMLEKKGVAGGVVNASGDLTAWGTRPDGSPWKAGIAHPDKSPSVLLWLPINDASIATSGDYEQYFELNGVRYSHNIDPKTGLPVRGIKSVSVISPAAELSDALATAVTVMGIEAGLHMINQLPQTHCIIVDDNNKLYNSEKININITA